MNKNLWKALEYSRDGMFVPHELTEEILSKTIINKSDKVAVLFSYEMLPSLSDLGVEDVTLIHDTPKKYMRNLCDMYGYKIEKETKEMKFDLILGNPPFSKANEGKTAGKKSVNLYPEFFKMSLEKSDRVAMIMPRTDKQQQKDHNKRIVGNANSILSIGPEVFNIATDVWCVFADKNNTDKIEDYTRVEVKNDIEWFKGKMTSSKKHWETKRGHPVIHAIHQSGPQILQSKVMKKSTTLPDHGYSVMFGITAGSTHIVKCESQLVGVNVYSVWFKTKKEATEFKKALDDKLTDIDHLRGNMGVITIQGLKQIEF